MAEVTSLDDHRKMTASVCVMHMPPQEPKPDGPFTVTISDSSGKLFEVVLPDYSGALPADICIMGTAPFDNRVVVNLLAGAMRAFSGAI